MIRKRIPRRSRLSEEKTSYKFVGSVNVIISKLELEKQQHVSS